MEMETNLTISITKGCGTALVTPFRQDGSLDEVALRRHLRFQIESGIDFLVPCGTTGESPSLSSEEHFRVVEITVEEAKGQVPVMGGAGGNNTRRVCEGIQALERLGVDAILSVSPYYNKPTQEGLYQHYRTLAESTRLPILTYNVPGRTGSNIEPQTLARLAEIPNILGVKEASGNVGQSERILSLTPESFRLFSGDDAMTLPLMAIGACGVVSVASNVIPRQMAEMVSLCNAGDFPAARRLYRRILPLMHALFLESNPIPVKAALAMMGMIHPVYRLPLVPLHADNHAKLAQVMKNLGLLAEEKEYAVGGAD